MIEGDRASRSRRFLEVQAQYGEGNEVFADRLNARALELGLAAEWGPNRVSKVRGALQDLSTEDITVVASIDKDGRGYTYIAFGIPVAKGGDPWDALARTAKRAKRAG